MGDETYRSRSASSFLIRLSAIWKVVLTEGNEVARGKPRGRLAGDKTGASV